MTANSKSDNLQRQELFAELYKKAFPVAAKYVSRMGGTFDEARDVFQDTLVIYYEKVITANIPDNENAYLVGTAKHLWLKRYRENIQHTKLDNVNATQPHEITAINNDRLMHFLETAGKKCMELLTGFYYDQLSLTTIADKFGYSGVRSATV